MSNPVPDLLALTSIADGSQRLAAPIRNNFSAIQTADNEVITALSGGAVGQVLEAADASHVVWAFPPGYQLDRATLTSAVNITGTSEGSPTAVITGNSISYDGTEVKVEAAFPFTTTAGSNVNLYLILLRDSTVIGRVTVNTNAASATVSVPVKIEAFDTPSAGAHTYKVVAYTVSGTAVAGAGAGGSGAFLPAFLRVTKA